MPAEQGPSREKVDGALAWAESSGRCPHHDIYEFANRCGYCAWDTLSSAYRNLSEELTLVSEQRDSMAEKLEKAEALTLTREQEARAFLARAINAERAFLDSLARNNTNMDEWQTALVKAEALASALAKERDSYKEIAEHHKEAAREFEAANEKMKDALLEIANSNVGGIDEFAMARLAAEAIPVPAEASKDEYDCLKVDPDAEMPCGECGPCLRTKTTIQPEVKPCEGIKNGLRCSPCVEANSSCKSEVKP